MLIHVIAVSAGRLWREGLSKLLEGSEFTVHSDAEQILADPQALDPADQVILLYRESGASLGKLDWLAEARQRMPNAKIVIIASELRMDSFIRAMEAGADGYLTEDISGRALIRQLGVVVDGEKVLPGSLSSMILQTRAPPVQRTEKKVLPLSGREIDILRRLASGDSNKMIANALNLAESTVKGTIKLILRKIDATNRTQAAIWAMSNGLREETAAGAQTPAAAA